MDKKAKRSLIHGIINIFLPFPLIILRHSNLEVDNPWKLFIPIVILTFVPFISDALAIMIAGTRLRKSRDRRIWAGLILSILAIPLFILLRF